MKDMIKLVPVEITITELISYIIIGILSVVAVIVFLKMLKDFDRITRQ